MDTHACTQALNYICARGDLPALQSLVASDVNLNAVGYDGRTAMHVAASEGHLHIVKYLVHKVGACVFI